MLNEQEPEVTAKIYPAQFGQLMKDENQDTGKVTMVNRVQAAVKFSNPSMRENIDQAMRFMEQNYPKDIKLGDVARQIYYSPCYFSRVFKELRGCSFRQYLTEIRMAQARRLLLHSDLHISEIAQRVGYHDVHYFINVFKQWEGCTPRGYRKTQRHRKI
ncbi:hypothetical protein DCMF_15995 [Candidatus Formimonas warabiya]|uniref:HTH araC/xylS-type domain-containing protein n=1 Tax=Formimonas warabiya TaxID=1761012 RepID=A0A3G1KUH5_FORW1|nr:hypothetical protein DCMF_15995 [Candidatus Formimonas warabiya]